MAQNSLQMTKSGFCQWPGLDNAHRFCQTENCTCDCHEGDK